MEEPTLQTIQNAYQKGNSYEIFEQIQGKGKALEGKQRILRIITRYNDMMVLTGIYDEFKNAFLQSDESRRAMLTDGCFIYQKKNEELKVIPLEENLSINDDFKKEVGKNKENIFFWPGCNMSIPKNARIILSFNKPYPSVFIKETKGDKEIFIEESSWHVDYIANDGFLVPKSDNKEIASKLLSETTLVRKKKVSISKEDFKSNITSGKDYQTINMEVAEALKNCDVVVQVPYLAPSADMLLKVSFNDEKDEIILSTS